MSALGHLAAGALLSVVLAAGRVNAQAIGEPGGIAPSAGAPTPADAAPASPTPEPLMPIASPDAPSEAAPGVAEPEAIVPATAAPAAQESTPSTPAPAQAPKPTAGSTAPVAGAAPVPVAADRWHEAPFAGSTLAAAVGYGNSSDQSGGVALGAFGMLQLSRSSDWTIGIPAVVAHVGATPQNALLLMSGVHIGRDMHFEVLAGLVNGAKRKTTTVTDFAAGTLSKETSYSASSSFGGAAVLGLTLELASRFGLSTEIMLAKGLEADGFVGAILIGPAFFPAGTRKP